MENDNKAQGRKRDRSEIVMEALLERRDAAAMRGPADVDIANGLVCQKAQGHHHQDRRVDLQKQPEQDRRAGERYQDKMKRRLVGTEALDAGAAVAPPVQRADDHPSWQQKEQQVVANDEGLDGIHRIRNTGRDAMVAEDATRPGGSSPSRTG